MTRRRPVVITDAERSQDEQLRSRQIRYASMMGIRVVCLVIAGVLVSVRAPMLWLWLPLCILGMVLLPWMAVIIANDRLPKQRHRVARYVPRFLRRPSERELPSETAPDRRSLSATEERVIDVES